jgi:hypothetical protein
MAVVLVTGLTARADESSLRDFFGYSGAVSHVEITDAADASRSALVTFADASSLQTALLLTGATIVAGDPPITVVEAPGSTAAVAKDSAYKPALLDLNKAHATLSALAGKGYALGKDAVARVKEFDEKHQASQKVSETAAKAAEAARNAASSLAEKARELNAKFKPVEKAQTAFANAGGPEAAQKVGKGLSNLWESSKAAAKSAAEKLRGGAKGAASAEPAVPEPAAE